MRHLFRLAVLFAVSILTLSASAAATDAGKPVIFLIQQDMLPLVRNHDFDQNLQGLLRLLPPARMTELHFFAGEQRRLLLSGPAGQLQWPVKGFTLSVPITGTDPFLSLTELITTRDLRDQPIYFITTGRPTNLHPGYASTGTVSPIAAARKLCQARNLQLEVLCVRDNSEIRHAELSKGGHYERQTYVDSKGNSTSQEYFVNEADLQPMDRPSDQFGYDTLCKLATLTGGKIYLNFEKFAGALPKP